MRSSVHRDRENRPFYVALNFLEQPQKGIIPIDNIQVDAEKIEKKNVHLLRQKTAMVFQHYNLFKHKTALENVTESLLVTRKKKKEEAIDIGKKLLKEVGLKEKKIVIPLHFRVVNSSE